jgi:hypothetical protein
VDETTAIRELGSAGGRARLLTHLGMVLAALAFSSWWTTHTVFDTTRSRRIAEVALTSAPLRAYVAEAIAPVVSAAVPTLLSSPVGSSTPAATEAVTPRLEAVLADPAIQAKLEQFIGDIHDRLVGIRSGPAILDPQTVAQLVAAADPQVTLADLARIPPVSIDVPTQRPLVDGSRTFRSRWPLYALGAVVLLAAAIAVTRDRRDTVRLIGKWLIGISIAQLVVLYVIPVLVVPRVTSNAWAGLVAAVAQEVGANLVTGLALMAAAGVACLFANRFIPQAAPSPPHLS